MPVKTFQVLSDNPSNDQVLHIFNHPHQLLVKLHLFVICCSFMLVNKKTVLNENRACVHVRWTEKSSNQIWFDWLIEFDASPQSFLEVSKKVCLSKGQNNETLLPAVTAISVLSL